MFSKKLRLLPEAVNVFCRYNILQPFFQRPFLPRAMHLIPTHKCNARCIMCGLWKKGSNTGQELTLENFDKILENKLFSRLEYVGISGGEPFLRPDLVELIDIYHNRCPSLKRISITTNGILTGLIKPAVERLLRLSRKKGVLLDISISFHGLDATLSYIYDVENAYEKIQQTIKVLKRLQQDGGLTISLNCVLLKRNIAEAPQLLKWANENKLPISFVVGEQRERFRNKEMESELLDSEGKRYLIKFLKKLSSDILHNKIEAIKYRDLADVIEGKKERTSSCYYYFSGFILGYDGTIYYCSHSKGIGNCRDRSAYEIFYDTSNLKYREKELYQKECKHCPPYTTTRMELEKDILRNAAILIKEWRRKK